MPPRRTPLAFGEVTLPQFSFLLVVVVLCFFVRSAYSAGGWRRAPWRAALMFTPVAALAVSQGVRRLPCSSSDCDPCQPSLLVFRIWIVNRRVVSCLASGLVCLFGRDVS